MNEANFKNEITRISREHEKRISQKQDNDQKKIPTLLDEVFILQPNNVTFGRYKLTSVQENILTLIMEALQGYMTRGDIPRDLFNQPYVEICCTEAQQGNNKNNVFQSVEDMAKKKFSFKWTSEKMGREIETSGMLISTWHDVKKTNKIIINFNIWAIPFLLYYGKSVGGTYFRKKLSLSMSSNYSKRIYKMLERWHDKKKFEYKLDDFKEDMMIPKSYTNNKIKEKVLEVAVKEINEFNPLKHIDFELVCKNPLKGRKPKMDTIIFYIINKNKEALEGDYAKEYQTVFNWMTLCYGGFSSKALDITDKLLESEQLEKVYSRVIFYKNQLDNKEKTMPHIINSLKKMMFEEYNISK